MTIDDIKKNDRLSTSYLTHNYHTYPAKYIPQIPSYFILKYTKVGDVVYDPFVGCGTTLVECVLLGRKGIGVDSNPIATLISKAKTTLLNEDEIKQIREFINSRIYEAEKFEIDGIKIPEFSNINHWFELSVQKELAYLLKRINELKNEKLATFLKTAFSAIVVEVSNQESDTRYARKTNSIIAGGVYLLFVRKASAMLERMRLMTQEAKTQQSIDIYNKSSESVCEIKDATVDLVITSPPYANTYDYYLYHKHRINWLGFNLKQTQQVEIGSREKHSSKKQGIEDFLRSLQKCFEEAVRTLKPGGHFVVVIGDSVIGGKHHSAFDFTNEMMSGLGMKLISNHSQQLQKTTRMFNPKFTNSEKFEHIIVFQK